MTVPAHSLSGCKAARGIAQQDEERGDKQMEEVLINIANKSAL